jgi:hypothetical protein
MTIVIQVLEKDSIWIIISSTRRFEEDESEATE